MTSLKNSNVGFSEAQNASWLRSSISLHRFQMAWGTSCHILGGKYGHDTYAAVKIYAQNDFHRKRKYFTLYLGSLVSVHPIVQYVQSTHTCRYVYMTVAIMLLLQHTAGSQSTGIITCTRHVDKVII